MKEQIIKEGGKSYLVLSIYPNLAYGFISSTGKSFCFRVNGTYLNSKGVVVGKEGRMSGYISSKIRSKVLFTNTLRAHYNQNHIIKHDFDGMIQDAIKIPIHNIAA